MFRIISTLAKTSKLANIHPLEKAILTITPIIIAGLSIDWVLPAVNILIFAILHAAYKNPARIVLKFMLGVGLFAVISSITFVFDYGLMYCAVVILKCLSGGISVAFLAMTTPIDDLLGMMSKNDSLRDVCDIAKSMERFLTLIEDESSILYRAIKSRGGFDGFSVSISSTGRLAGLLFINTMKRWTEIKDSINSRCYKGYMPYLRKQFDFSPKRLGLICLYNVMLIIGLLVLSFVN